MKRNIFAFAVLFSFLMIGCSNKPSPQELTVLQEQIRSAEAAEHRSQIVQQEKNDLQSDIHTLELENNRLKAQLVALEGKKP